jgi:aspartate carbamoyltransferase catalytic subunit
MKLNHVVSARQFDTKTLQKLFSLTDKIKSGKYNKTALKGKIMATLFYEPSTRTRLSFESAMLRLGGSVITTENAAEFSSAIKGETLEDTIRIVNGYSDIIVLRHSTSGASKIAASCSKFPVINAGDGSGEHPTQALLDLYTIFSAKRNKKIKVVMVGDLKNGRTIHSLCYLLSLYKTIHLVFVAPKALAIPKEILGFLVKSKIKFEETEDLINALGNADIVYQTRIQKERFVNSKKGKIDSKEYKKYFGKYIIDKNILKKMGVNTIIMHPLPRVNEITPEVDLDKRAYYFHQAQNGLYVRMALLLSIFDKV